MMRRRRRGRRRRIYIERAQKLVQIVDVEQREISHSMEGRCDVIESDHRPSEFLFGYVSFFFFRMSNVLLLPREMR